MERFLASVERRAFRMARIATGSPEDALDIVQDAMFRLVRRYGGKSEEEWRPVFFRILQNRIRDHLRRRRFRGLWRVRPGSGNRGDTDPAVDPLDAVADPNARSPAEQARTGESLRRLEAALRSLPTRQQQVFLLRAWEEMSVKETAAVMGCSEGTVKTHFSRALHTLRGMLEDHRP